jgi:hypothetical protein
MNEKSKFENLFILTCGIITGILVYYNYQEPQIETEKLYIRDTISDTYTFTWESQAKRTGWKQHLSVWNNWNTITKKESWTTKPKDNKWLKFMGSVQSGTVIRHLWFDTWDIRQNYINYAYKIWWENLMLLWECENWTWNIDTLGDNWNAYWFCQASINIPERMEDHKRIDKDRFKTDRMYQLDSCWRLRQEWTPFYWPERKIYKQWRYMWMCYEYVKSRFTVVNK